MAQVDDYLEQAGSSSPGTRREGLEKLAKLSEDYENLTPLFETPGVVDALLKAANDESVALITAGLTGLFNLALDAEIKTRLAQNPEVKVVATKVANEGRSRSVVEEAIKLMAIVTL
jgi:hypothetical protein